MNVKGLLRKVGIASEDRRRSPRIRCRLHCSLEGGRKSVRARVLDVSEGGLCVLSPVAFPPRQSLRIEIDTPSLGSVEVEALVWHVREVRRKGMSRPAWSIGMMITKFDSRFDALLLYGSGELEDSRTVARAAADRSHSDAESARADGSHPGGPKDASAPEEESTPDDPVRPFRLRVRTQSSTGPRTRTLTLGADSADEARELAEAELGEDWTVLEVKPA